MSQESEFICEVVKVDAVLPHPNADKLELIVTRGFTVVASKGEWKPDDVCIHVGPDSLVPLDSSSFSFLKTRLDVKPGSSHYRIKAAKIRQVVSHGIIVPIPEFMHGLTLRSGQDVSNQLGVLKYETQAERRLRESELVTVQNLSRLQKLVRRVKTYLGLDRFTSNLTSVRRSVPDYTVTNLRKAPGFFELGEVVEVSEKLHGSNIRLGLINGKPYIGSHHAVKSDHTTWFGRLFGKKSTKNHFYGKDIWTEWCKDQIDFKELPDNTIFYGEIFGPGVQELTYGVKGHHVRVFDVWFVDEKRWATYTEKLHLCFMHKFDMVPLLWSGKLDGVGEFTNHVNGKSTLTDKHIREGIVIKSMDGKKRAKLVSDDYKMRKDS